MATLRHPGELDEEATSDARARWCVAVRAWHRRQSDMHVRGALAGRCLATLQVDE
jgi:hypothetical protein